MDTQQLMRVYGALMWSLGKVLTCPEVPRVYIGNIDQSEAYITTVDQSEACILTVDQSGSWWDKQLRNTDSRSLFEREEQDLFRDFRDMPRGAALRWETEDLTKYMTKLNQETE